MRHTTATPWTTKQLVHLSQSLAEAYGLGLASNQGNAASDRWNSQRFVELSAAKSTLQS